MTAIDHDGPANGDPASPGRRRLSAPAQAALFGLIAVIALTALAKFADRASDGDHQFGPRGSSISTGTEGTAAWRELLRRYNVEVREQRGELKAANLDTSATLVVLDPWDMPSDATGALRDFVNSGGRLVAGGFSPQWLTKIVTDLPTWKSEAPPRRAGLRGERFLIEGLPEGAWQQPARLVAIRGVGQGEVRAVANSSPLQNQLLGAADNAAFAVSLVGTDRPVVFAEGVHGFGRRSGIRAIPQRWKTALVLGTLAALLTAMASSRRLGPPERTARALPPPRVAYVDAMAELLRRAKQPRTALAPLQAELRGAVAARSGGAVGSDDPSALAEFARQLGWSAEDVSALDGTLANDEAVLHLGRALAKARADS